MKLWPPAIALLGALSIAAGTRPSPSGATLIVTGDTDGYLSPCGCTKPMSGGIRRRTTVVRELARSGATLVDSGGLIQGNRRQDELKALALAQALADAGYDAVHLSPSESQLGIGGIASLTNILGSKSLASTLEPSSRLPIQPLVVDGPFVIAGISSRPARLAADLNEKDRGVRAAIDELLTIASQSGAISVVLFQGSLEEARKLPRVDEISLVVFRSAGDPTDRPIVEGRTSFVSPGEKGKHVLSIGMDNGAIARFAVHKLPPEVHDDPAAARFFRRYLKAVTSEDLLDQMPRTGSARFAGSATCGSCHGKAYAAWKKSEHGHALTTLDKVGQARDPECVGCHVVGLAVKGGFTSGAKTPRLSHVGCESCHGPGAQHAKAPLRFRLGEAGERSCMPCHVPDHSPGFDFAEYWPKIAH